MDVKSCRLRIGFGDTLYRPGLWFLAADDVCLSGCGGDGGTRHRLARACLAAG